MFKHELPYKLEPREDWLTRAVQHPDLQHRIPVPLADSVPFKLALDGLDFTIMYRETIHWN